MSGFPRKKENVDMIRISSEMYLKNEPFDEKPKFPRRVSSTYNLLWFQISIESIRFIVTLKIEDIKQDLIQIIHLR
jgi:hypothetical protein